MGRETQLHKKGVTVADRTTSACILCGEARQDIPQEDDRASVSNQRTAPKDQAECGLQVRHAVVGSILA